MSTQSTLQRQDQEARIAYRAAVASQGGLPAAGLELHPSVHVQRAISDRRGLTPGGVLHLQRTIGNRAVSRLLTRSVSTARASGGLAPGIDTEEENVTIGGLTTAESEIGAAAGLAGAVPSSLGGTLAAGDELAAGRPMPAGQPMTAGLDDPIGDFRARHSASAIAAGQRQLLGGLTGPAQIMRRKGGGSASTAAAITVSTTTNTGPTWNPHGHFDWRVGFNTSGRNGWLVQKIINTFSGTDSSGGAIPSGLTPTYWEAWAVDGSGKVTPNVGPNNDYWIRSSKGTGTKGTWSMRGEVHFTKTDPATQGFTPGGVANAGILLSTTSAPSGLGAILQNRSANGTWDSTGTTPTHTGATT